MYSTSEVLYGFWFGSTVYVKLFSSLYTLCNKNQDRKNEVHTIKIENWACSGHTQQLTNYISTCSFKHLCNQWQLAKFSFTLCNPGGYVQKRNKVHWHILYSMCTLFSRARLEEEAQVDGQK